MIVTKSRIYEKRIILPEFRNDNKDKSWCKSILEIIVEKEDKQALYAYLKRGYEWVDLLELACKYYKPHIIDFVINTTKKVSIPAIFASENLTLLNFFIPKLTIDQVAGTILNNKEKLFSRLWFKIHKI